MLQNIATRLESLTQWYMDGHYTWDIRGRCERALLAHFKHMNQEDSDVLFNDMDAADFYVELNTLSLMMPTEGTPARLEAGFDLCLLDPFTQRLINLPKSEHRNFYDTFPRRVLWQQTIGMQTETTVSYANQTLPTQPCLQAVEMVQLAEHLNSLEKALKSIVVQDVIDTTYQHALWRQREMSGRQIHTDELCLSRNTIIITVADYNYHNIQLESSLGTVTISMDCFHHKSPHDMKHLGQFICELDQWGYNGRFTDEFAVELGSTITRNHTLEHQNAIKVTQR